MSKDKTTVYKSQDGHRWHAIAANGRIVAESGEAYKRQSTCVKMAVKYSPFSRIQTAGRGTKVCRKASK